MTRLAMTLHRSFFRLLMDGYPDPRTSGRMSARVNSKPQTKIDRLIDLRKYAASAGRVIYLLEMYSIFSSWKISVVMDWIHHPLAWLSHYGTVGQNQVVSRHPIIHFPTSSGVSKRTSEQMSAAEHVGKASSLEQANEWAVRANKRTDERET